MHWLVGALRRAEVPSADSFEMEAGTPIEEAWRRAAAHCAVDADAVAAAVARAFRTEVADFGAASPHATRLLPASLAREHNVYPLLDRNRQLVLATPDPTDMEMERAVGFASGRDPVLHVAPPAAVQKAVEAGYAEGAVEVLLKAVGSLSDEMRVIEEQAEEQLRPEDVTSGPVVRLTNAILVEAVQRGVSDIHIQQMGVAGVVRYRIDGVLHTAMQMPLPVMTRVLSRIKVLGNLNIAVRVRPQDGRARIEVRGREYDLRISTVPTRESEKCVIRILDPSASKALADTGIPAQELEQLRRLLQGRDGIVIVTGPTGSGKTTTLYAALREIAGEDVNIMTVEDPVEYELPGLTQLQVDAKRGVTFAGALRAILRQDPDVIFVGEIRDDETAAVAAQAAQTGHLVLATLHTNDAASSVRRLQDLGLDAASVSVTLRGCIAQRLVRRLCPDCVTEVHDASELPEEERKLAQRYGFVPPRRAVGCMACHETGYRGRMPLMELMVVNPELQGLILEGAGVGALEAAGRKAGMRTLRDAGLRRVRDGQTTLEELERVLGDSMAGDADAEGGAAAAEGWEEPDERTRVLIVDDDMSNRIITRALLEREGFLVEEAEDGEQALQLLEGPTVFSLAVVDLDMPKMGGEELLGRVRGSRATIGLPIVVLTGRGGTDTEIEIMEKGADDYIRKPFAPALFVARVKATLRRARG
jgi:type II secretory ATPase GspE/PulE/Tfp pilus assembly ATPase PilB-like protein/CheY-like chemotaxis protein